MRLTFVHDHKFIYKDGNYYSSGKFSEEILERYMVGPIDNIQFIGRIQENFDEANHLVRTSNENITIRPMNFLKKKSHFITKRKAMRTFLKEYIDEKDIVIVRLPSEVGYVALNFLENKKIPYGIELVGDPWDALWYHGSIAAKGMAVINKTKVKKHIRNSNNNIYVTKHYLQKKYPSSKNNFVASNVLINEVKNNYKNKNRSVKRIGMIGSLDTKYKGIDTALKSLSMINMNFSFEIVGNGPQEIWEKKIADYNLEKKVCLKGTLKSGKDIDEWLSTLDLYIQPSYTEGLPRALIEAMSNGIPALGSNAGGIPELLDKEFIHKVRDYKVLSNQIETVLKNSALRESMSTKNIKVSKDYLSNRIQAEREAFIESIYKEHDNL
jgi:glycosyltransferase involved in cell wall biosynthesis